MGSKKKVENGENIPLSFYFDLSGSMNKYVKILSMMALRMLRKNVKIIIGFNQNAYVQINKISEKCSNKEFVKIMLMLQEIVLYEDAEEELYYDSSSKLLKKIELESLKGQEIDKYLIEKKAEKVLVFSDFDPKTNIENLSEQCEVYWFCFRTAYRMYDLDNFKGKFFRTQNELDIVNHLKNIKSRTYERKQRKLGFLKYLSINEYLYDEKFNNNYDYDYDEFIDEYGEDIDER